MPAGTEFHKIFLELSMNLGISSVSRMSFAISSLPPAINVPKISYTERSKQYEESPRIVEFSFTPMRSLMSMMVFIIAAYEMSTPFGTPVLPEV